jgi:O-antigen ligase
MTDMELQPRLRAAPTVQTRESAQHDPISGIPPWLIIAAAFVAAATFGHFIADGRIKYGAAILLAACYAPLVFFNITVALATWLALLYFSQLHFLSSGPNAMGVLLALGWFGAFLGRKRGFPLLSQNRKLLLSMVLFGLWLTLTIAWSGLPSKGATVAGYWWLGPLAFLIVATTVSSARDVRLIAVAFVAGALVSVLIGLASGGLSVSDSASTQTAIQGRFSGGGGDPNEQAAGLVAAMFLIIGLFSVYRTRRARRLLLLAFTLVTVGFITAQSRGALIALGVATLLAVLLAPRQRRRILGMMGIAGVAAGALLVIRPDALQRIVDLGGGSSGRSDLWTVGWRVFTSHPLLGVGIGNFQAVEARFVLRPGSITAIQYLTDAPHLVHNVYLQLLAETGIVGLLGFVVVVVGVLRASWLAIQEFEMRGRVDYADLTRAVMMGTIGMLTALFFISDGTDLRLWALFGLGPALLAVARRRTATSSSKRFGPRSQPVGWPQRPAAERRGPGDPRG